MGDIVYEIPVVWQCSGIVKVSAKSKQDALDKTKRHIKDFALPIHSEYVDDSLDLSCDNDEDMLEAIVPDKKMVWEEIREFHDPVEPSEEDEDE